MTVLSRCLALAFVSLVVMGCNKGPVMYQVSGKVKFKDGSVPNTPVCLVNFVPSKDSKTGRGRNATGHIEPDGSFTMYTRMPGDGVHPGDYRVLFNISKSAMAPVSILLPKYTDVNSPAYKVTVDHNISDLDYTIEPLPGGGT